MRPGRLAFLFVFLVGLSSTGCEIFGSDTTAYTAVAAGRGELAPLPWETGCRYFSSNSAPCTLQGGTLAIADNGSAEVVLRVASTHFAPEQIHRGRASYSNGSIHLLVTRMTWGDFRPIADQDIPAVEHPVRPAGSDTLTVQCLFFNNTSDCIDVVFKLDR